MTMPETIPQPTPAPAPICVACVGDGTDPVTGGPCLRCKGTAIDPDPLAPTGIAVAS
jgi:hypothetical protein